MAGFGTNAEDAPVLRFADVSRVHEAGASRVVSLEHADLTLHAGEFVAIMGPSGSGKSTLLNLAGGLDLPTEGRVFVDGVDLTKLDAAAAGHVAAATDRLCLSGLQSSAVA